MVCLCETEGVFCNVFFIGLFPPPGLQKTLVQFTINISNPLIPYSLITQFPNTHFPTFPIHHSLIPHSPFLQTTRPLDHNLTIPHPHIPANIANATSLMLPLLFQLILIIPSFSPLAPTTFPNSPASYSLITQFLNSPNPQSPIPSSCITQFPNSPIPHSPFPHPTFPHPQDHQTTRSQFSHPPSPHCY